MGLSKIQWTDWTFNPWIGCRKVAAECANCYAETLDRNRYSKTLDGGTKENPVSHWGSGQRHRTSASNWKLPLKWDRDAQRYEKMREANGIHHERPRVFCASLADWLDDENVPIEWLSDLLTLIRDTPNLDWLLLTKRAQKWTVRMEAVHKLKFSKDTFTAATPWLSGERPENVWIGVSAGADQQAALDIPARVHFLSCEPMLNPLEENGTSARFDWIILGGESGSKARRCHTDWIREGVRFCRQEGIAPFVKQLGSNCYAAGRDQKHLIALKDSHGGNMDEWPEDLRVREFPTVK